MENLVSKILVSRSQCGVYFNLDTKKLNKQSTVDKKQNFHVNTVYMIFCTDLNNLDAHARYLNKYFKKLSRLEVLNALKCIHEGIAYDKLEKGSKSRLPNYNLDILTIGYVYTYTGNNIGLDVVLNTYTEARKTYNENIDTKRIGKTFAINNSEKVKEIKEVKEVKRQVIPANVRKEVWNTYVGAKDVGACFCCDAEISDSKSSWHCGHILSDKYGGNAEVNNLRPICVLCNTSMGAMHMYRYMIYNSLNVKKLDKKDQYVIDSKNKIKMNKLLFERIDQLIEKKTLTLKDKELFIKKLKKEYPLGLDDNYQALTKYIRSLK